MLAVMLLIQALIRNSCVSRLSGRRIHGADAFASIL